MRLRSVVLPLPRKPVTIVTGIGDIKSPYIVLAYTHGVLRTTSTWRKSWCRVNHQCPWLPHCASLAQRFARSRSFDDQPVMLWAPLLLEIEHILPEIIG